ncbi:MAG TPA: MFS transporter [Candidatus Thermoplasmatota archaeon]|nr:MFS transporter [Candidatus Thermoplasmatota archaeon]
MTQGSAHKTGVLVGVLFTVVLAGIDTTVVSTVMPVALGELGGRELYAWTFAAYILATAISMPIWGPGSDRWGRKRTYLVGVTVFVIGSLACAAAPTMPWFIAARALQGIGAGAVSSLPFIVLGVVFPPEKRAKALGIVSSAWAIASVAGPLMGTLIITSASWRWVFLINLPVGLLAAFLVGRGMRESTGARTGRFDIAGALLAGAAGSALIWSFTELGEGHMGVLQGALIASGIALLGVFVWHESRAESPILPLAFFRHRGYSAAMGASFLTFFCGMGLSAYLPIETSAVFPGDAIAIGLVVGTFTVGWSMSAFGTSRLIHRYGERVFGLVGLALHLVGLLALVVAFDHGLRVAMLAAFLAGAGMGILSPGLTVVVQNSVPVQRMGSATTSQQFTRQLGAALGIASFVLAARLAGWRGGLFVMLAMAAAALVFLLAVPAHSLAEHRSTPAHEVG